MTAATAIIVYATQSKILRYKITADTDAEIQAAQKLFQPQPGESFLILPGPPYDDQTCKLAIQQATGVVPPDDRCAMVDGNNTVVAILKADLALCSFPGQTLVPSATAALGATYNPQTKLFINPVVALPIGA